MEESTTKKKNVALSKIFLANQYIAHQHFFKIECCSKRDREKRVRENGERERVTNSCFNMYKSIGIV
jgi:hypothetical protein